MFKVGDKIVRDKDAGHSRFGAKLESGKAYTVASIEEWSNSLSLKEFPEEGQKWSITLWSKAPEAATPTSRSNDPATGKGVRRVNKYEQAVLDTLGRHKDWYKVGPPAMWVEGMTGKELALFTDLPLNSLTPRFAPLRRKGLIKDSGLRRDKQIVWVLA